ncbi:hypothetical protein FB451DRAFT_1421405 [Mycena latifolia]|nr:hypothetical protein FB451DRAFT_1421405 [Mycena latifolia]
MALSLQPPELLDAIVSFIPLPKDLLSLALVSKTLHAIVIPQHLEFRVVRCDARRPLLWNAFTEHPGLSGRIRCLDICSVAVRLYSTRSLAPKSLTLVKDTRPVDCDSTDLQTLSLPELLDLPPLPHLRWLSAPQFFDGGFPIVPEHLPLLEYAAMTDVYRPAQTNIKEVIRVLLALPALRGATLSFTTPSGLRKLSVEVPHLARLVLARSPWNPDRMRFPETSLPTLEYLHILTSFAHLTHLDSSAAIQADLVLDQFLRWLAGSPQLQYVGLT